MRDTRYIIATAMLLACSIASAQTQTPSVGYVYPAGGQRGTTVRVVVAGQYVRSVKTAFVSGDGVTVKNIVPMRSYKNLNTEQKYILADLMMKSVMRNLEDANLGEEQIEKFKSALIRQYPWSILKRKKELDLEGETLPEHPLFLDLEKKNMRELAHIKTIVSIPRSKLQINRQLGEPVLMDIIIDADAKLGERELILQTSKGPANPLLFKVGAKREVRELEPNDTEAYQAPWEMSHIKSLLEGKPYTVPCVFNGQITPGDVDRFRFKASKGQKLIIEAEARRLIPYLADTVPGWFQAVIAVYDSNGKEVAYADDHFINPDPVLCLEVPENGEYEIEVRDSIYRGREDFVYRVSVSLDPELVNEFKNGLKYGDRWTRKAVLPAAMRLKDVVPADVAALPSASDKGRNDDIGDAQSLKLPVFLNGSISEPGDKDVYKVKVEGKQKLAVEVFARRLGSPLDSFVKVTDKKGTIIASNDDYSVKEKHLHIDELGLVTHHADSSLMADLPGKGTYYVHVHDAQGHGGSRYGYRLRVSKPMPGFILRATPSVLALRRNECVPIKVYAARRDGYEGPIHIEAVDIDKSFVVTGNTMPAGSLSSVMTLQATKKGDGHPSEIELIGKADVDGKTVTASVKPAEKTMQAFLFEHLVPASKMTCTVRKEKWGSPSLIRLDEQNVTLLPGTKKTLRYELSWEPKSTELEMVLVDGPEGLEIDKKPRLEGKVFEFDLTAGKDMKPIERNIIVSLWGSRMTKPKDGKPKRSTRWQIRMLSAIPIKVST